VIILLCWRVGQGGCAAGASVVISPDATECAVPPAKVIRAKVN
jgi:hypothetical protein